MYKYIKGTGLLLQALQTLIFTGDTTKLQSCVTFGTEWMKMRPLTYFRHQLDGKPNGTQLRSEQGGEEIQRHPQRRTNANWQRYALKVILSEGRVLSNKTYHSVL